MADQTRTYSGPFLEGTVAVLGRDVPFVRGEPVDVSADEADVLDLLPEWAKPAKSKPTKSEATAAGTKETTP